MGVGFSNELTYRSSGRPRSLSAALAHLQQRSNHTTGLSYEVSGKVALKQALACADRELRQSQHGPSTQPPPDPDVQLPSKFPALRSRTASPRMSHTNAVPHGTPLASMRTAAPRRFLAPRDHQPAAPSDLWGKQSGSQTAS